MSIRETIVTPEMAKELLDKNVSNRSLSRRRVDALAEVMRKGEWQYNGDTIRIAKSGRLLDGQHRLSAIERSGIPQKYIIVDGLDDSSFTTIDIGSARSSSQMLGMVGAKNAAALAAAAKMHLMLVKHGQPMHGSVDKQATHTQIVDFAQDNIELYESTRFGIQKWCRKYITPSIATLCHYEFGIIDKEKRDKFFEELTSGDFSYQNSPIKFIRELFIEERGSSYAPDKKKRIGLMFKAFNLFKAGKESKIVRLPKNVDEWFKL